MKQAHSSRQRRRSTARSAGPGPVLIQAVVDPLEAPMPATVSREQATRFAESILRGQPKGLEIARHGLGDMISEMV
jgi:pyruvate dehydrogenase (quinone)